MTEAKKETIPAGSGKEQTKETPDAKKCMQLRNTKKFLSLLGIAKKAGKVSAGTDLVIDAIRAGSPKTCPQAVFLSENASENTKKRLVNSCKYYDIPLHVLPCTGAELGSAIGKAGLISAVGISDKGLSDALSNLLSSFS